MRIQTINLWKYWKKEYGMRDFTLIDIQWCSIFEHFRFVICNIGVKIQ